MKNTDSETSFYLGYRVVIKRSDLVVHAPNGDQRRFTTMLAARAWVRAHRRRTKSS